MEQNFAEKMDRVALKFKQFSIHHFSKFKHTVEINACPRFMIHRSKF